MPVIPKDTKKEVMQGPGLRPWTAQALVSPERVKGEEQKMGESSGKRVSKPIRLSPRARPMAAVKADGMTEPHVVENRRVKEIKERLFRGTEQSTAKAPAPEKLQFSGPRDDDIDVWHQPNRPLSNVEGSLVSVEDSSTYSEHQVPCDDGLCDICYLTSSEGDSEISFDPEEFMEVMTRKVEVTFIQGEGTPVVDDTVTGSSTKESRATQTPTDSYFSQGEIRSSPVARMPIEPCPKKLAAYMEEYKKKKRASSLTGQSITHTEDSGEQVGKKTPLMDTTGKLQGQQAHRSTVTGEQRHQQTTKHNDSSRQEKTLLTHGHDSEGYPTLDQGEEIMSPLEQLQKLVTNLVPSTDGAIDPKTHDALGKLWNISKSSTIDDHNVADQVNQKGKDWPLSAEEGGNRVKETDRETIRAQPMDKYSPAEERPTAPVNVKYDLKIQSESPIVPIDVVSKSKEHSKPRVIKEPFVTMETQPPSASGVGKQSSNLSFKDRQEHMRRATASHPLLPKSPSREATIDPIRTPRIGNLSRPPLSRSAWYGKPACTDPDCQECKDMGYLSPGCHGKNKGAKDE
ncbi:hypothetical protein BJ170DRAFT_594855 [Xylariales sp. AK1849]|nr:hypothetical protein BJ170DRAFT_594855 [Xylariales sp. AK1849]